MSDPRKPIDNGRSWKAEFLPGSPGEKAIESLGLRPDHLRHDLVAFDEQIESLAAEIARLREQLRAKSCECTGEWGKASGLEMVNESLRARLAAWKAEGETWRKWCDTEPEAVISEPLLWQDVVNARAATDAIEKNAS